MARKLLMTSVCKPFGEAHGDAPLVRAEGGYQLMWAQGVFMSEGTSTQWGIDFIAANLDIPTVTLHYPTMRRFIAELRRGYDYVGIAFVASTLHKLIPMVQAVRRHAPDSEIILGGYGTSLPDDELAPLADHICRGEGVAFMRELLGEPAREGFTQPDIVQRRSIFSIPIPTGSGFVFAGLGCPNGCEFCATSHYFDRRYLPFLPDGVAVFEAVQEMRRRHPGMVNFYITDEDFLLDERRGRGFLEAIRSSDLPAVSISLLSSVKGVSQYDPLELVEMGVDWIWIGYEATGATFDKLKGKPRAELFADLRAHGINIMASMILGMDHHTPDVVRQEFDELMALRPAMSQYMLYNLDYKTPLYHRMKAEGRVRDEVFDDRSRWDGTSLMFQHPAFTAEELPALQRELYHQEYQRLGPSVFRMTENFLEGWTSLRDHPLPRVRAKASKYRHDAHRNMAILPASIGHALPHQRPWLRDLYARLARETGPLSGKDRLLAQAVRPMIRLTQLRQRTGLWQQPKTTRGAWRC
jgi:radical SAM superfamily enzyme YgiQ (UPF0313 family)